MDTYDRAALDALLADVCHPLEVEEQVYDTTGELLYRGAPGQCRARIGIDSTKTRFLIHDHDGSAIAQITVVHELHDEYDPHEALAAARALALFTARAPDHLERLVG